MKKIDSKEFKKMSLGDFHNFINSRIEELEAEKIEGVEYPKIGTDVVKEIKETPAPDIWEEIDEIDNNVVNTHGDTYQSRYSITEKQVNEFKGGPPFLVAVEDLEGKRRVFTTLVDAQKLTKVHPTTIRKYCNINDDLKTEGSELKFKKPEMVLFYRIENEQKNKGRG